MPPATSGGSWNFLFTDTVAGDLATGTFSMAGIIVLGSGGPAPFPTTYSYVSAPHDIGKASSFSPVRWGLRQETPDTKVTVSLRTCDTAEACNAEPWIAIGRGLAPEATPRRFAQYKIELTGSGDVPTALDWIQIGYRPR